jgi:hypothetical protein
MKSLAISLLVTFPLAAAAAEPPAGFTALFNGKDLSGWKPTGKAENWTAEDGMIVCKKGGGGYLLTDKEYGDFEFRCEFRWSKEGGNSGVGIRTPEKGDPAYVGMEIQLIDDENWAKVHKFELKDTQHTGSLYGVKASSKLANKPIGEWNAVRVVCKGRKIIVEMNGETINEVNLDEYEEAKGKTVPGILRDKGHVGFQSYNFRVEFRNVWIKTMKTDH